MNTYYAVFAYFAQHDATEEVDVQANSFEEARAKATDILNADYLPGWEIVQVV